jgi:hypothetical protein
MSITSVSFTFVNMYASQSAARPVAAGRVSEQAAPLPASHDHESHRHIGRPNRLVQAMMTALRELGVGGQGAAAATPTGASAAVPVAEAATPMAAAAANDPTAVVLSAGDVPVSAAVASAGESKTDVESAVYQFAHELMKALRPGGDAEAGGHGRRVEGEHGGHRHHHHHRMHGHHGHHGWRREGYGDMSQRLEALAQRYAPQQPEEAAALPSAASASVDSTMNEGVAAVPQPPAMDAASDARPAADAAVALATPQVAATNPLLEAFTKLYSALQPQAARTMSEADMGDKLRVFLQSLAQALRPEGFAAPAPQPVGGLIDLAA